MKDEPLDDRALDRLTKFLVRQMGCDEGRIRKGDLKALRTALRKASKGVSERDWHALAECFFTVGLYKDSMRYYRGILKKTPSDARALNGLGVVMVRMGEPEMALKLYDSALALDTAYELAWFNKGKVLFAMEQLKPAARCFRTALGINKRNVSAWNNLGLVLKLLGDSDEAVKCYNTALKLDGKYHYAWNNLGYAHLALKDPARAATCFSRALDLVPGYEAAKKGLELCAKRPKRSGQRG